MGGNQPMQGRYGALWSTWDVWSKEGLCMGHNSTAQLKMKKGGTFMHSSTQPLDQPIELGQTSQTLH
ncbi:unnamed protein product [Microthlaspi erraticum]|uniref:Uncharacterized protein n=1 Tax=Microthlaspi erraticum TaxID=1685480 RepID=A0A6D2IU98_9BRAS|nr:unnamed protein product [Microthlaspi erraticum]